MHTTTSHDRDDRAAVDKAVSLLLCFGSDASSGVGVAELARRAELSKSTAFRVLGLLERNGVVERVGRQYRLGAKLHDLGRNVYSPDHDRIRDLLIPYLSDLYEQTHETVHLAALHGLDVTYLAKLYGHRRVPCPSRIGGRVPAYCTAVGKALLAHSPESLERLRTAELEPLTAHTITDHGELVTQLARVRREGVAYDLEEVRIGLTCVAAPVLDPSGRPVAALSVSIGTGRRELHDVEKTLRLVVSGASRLIAHDAMRRGQRTA
ncbi:IclR family transcriptional regulator [Kribbella sp. NPDC055071]